tara:strand:- start:816 stop:1046 length:231 start_codon:yes stop_codon:yes gene_type:complete
LIKQGKNFWIKNYDKNLEGSVEWKEFKVKFYNFMRLPLPDNEDDRNNIGVMDINNILKTTTTTAVTWEIKLTVFAE